MAVVGMTMSYRGGASVPVVRGRDPRVSEVKTSFAASTQFTGTAVAGEYITVATDTAIWVKINSNPTAAAGDDFLLPAGQIMSWEAMEGDKVAIIAA